MAHQVVQVKFIEYYSYQFMEEQLERILLRTRCDSSGTLKLKLDRNNNLRQEGGPHIITNTDWLRDYEDFAEFTVVCYVKEV